MRVVLDASACAEFLLGTALGNQVGSVLVQEELHAPHLVVTEVVCVLRGWNLGGKLSDDRAALACADLADLPWTLWDATPLIGATWRLRRNVSTYDATYLALADALGFPVITTDAHFAAAVGDPSRCVLMPRGR